jgi:antitoxin component YwqK of YwqJK toxin-antitoxin module
MMQTFRIIIVFLLLPFFQFAQTKKAENKLDEKGKKQGYWEKKDEKGFLIFQGEFKDDKPVGKMKQFYKGTDSLKALLHYRKEGYVYAILYNEVNYKKNAEGKYFNEKRDSTWNFYDEQNKLISTEQYKKGKKDGSSKVYFPNGNLSEEANYVDDKKNGINKKWYDSGVLKLQQTYKMGLLEGLSTTYYPNKVEAARGYYKNGNKNHVWVYKKQDGSIDSKEYWWEGIEVKEVDYQKLKVSTTDNKEIIEPENKVQKTQKGKKGGNP